jgi:hypothetical protein
MAPFTLAQILAIATNTRARQVAMNAAKRRLQAEGLRVSAFTHRELAVKAEAYFADHRVELLAEAKADVEQWRRKGVFGKRAKLLSDAQGGKR